MPQNICIFPLPQACPHPPQYPISYIRYSYDAIRECRGRTGEKKVQEKEAIIRCNIGGDNGGEE